jgi:hypothetical protein
MVEEAYQEAKKAQEEVNLLLMEINQFIILLVVLDLNRMHSVVVIHTGVNYYLLGE